jgi:hypothetical protein
VEREQKPPLYRRLALEKFGEIPPFDGPTLRRLAASIRDPDDRGLWLAVAGFIGDSDVDAGWKQLVAAIDAASDDQVLCYLGMRIVEPFIDTHPYYVLEHLDEVRGSRNFRASLTCAESSVPPDVEEALAVLLPEAGSPDDIGGMGQDRT